MLFNTKNVASVRPVELIGYVTMSPFCERVHVLDDAACMVNIFHFDVHMHCK